MAREAAGVRAWLLGVGLQGAGLLGLSAAVVTVTAWEMR